MMGADKPKSGDKSSAALSSAWLREDTAPIEVKVLKEQIRASAGESGRLSSGEVTAPINVKALQQMLDHCLDQEEVQTQGTPEDAAQLLPSLLTLGDLAGGVWGRAKATFDTHMKGLDP